VVNLENSERLRLGLLNERTSSSHLRIEEDSEVELMNKVPRNTLQAAVVTVSDRCAAGETRDTAGPAVANLLVDQLEANIAWAGIVPDEQDQIVATLTDLCSRGIDLVVTVGGTGCAMRDVTPEATKQVIERELPGLAQKMRLDSSKITPHAWLQRGISGMRGGSLIVNLPGSKKAAVENLGFVLDVIPSALSHLHGTEVHVETESRTIDKSA
jgi:molybdopterin adenylyltransferase